MAIYEKTQHVIPTHLITKNTLRKTSNMLMLENKGACRSLNVLILYENTLSSPKSRHKIIKVLLSEQEVFMWDHWLKFCHYLVSLIYLPRLWLSYTDLLSVVKKLFIKWSTNCKATFIQGNRQFLVHSWSPIPTIDSIWQGLNTLHSLLVNFYNKLSIWLRLWFSNWLKLWFSLCGEV